MRRILARVGAVVLAAAATVIGLQSPAFAVGVEMSGPSGTSGYYAVDYANNAIVVLVRSGYLPAGKCATAYLDIARVYGVGKPGNHYDARAARTCKSYDSKTSSWQYEGGTYGIDIESVQKAAVCYGDLNTTGSCINKVGSVATVNPVSNSHNMCTRFWSESADGTQFYFSAGNPWECDN